MFVTNPPKLPEARKQEYRRLSERIVQVMLKLDSINIDGNPEGRLRRKALVRSMQNTLQEMDTVV